jgi:hypothetical protein
MTLTELKTLIKDYLQNSETTFVNDLNQIIKQAEDRILNSVQLPVFRKNQTGTTSTDNQYLSIPSDFLANYSLSVTDSSGNQQFLLNKDVNWIRETYPSATATGSGSFPKYYAIFSDDYFIMSPTPGAAFTTEIHYFYKPASITAGATGGTTWLSTNAESALLYGSLVESYTFMKGEPDLMQLYRERYDEAIARLKVLGDGRDRKDAYRGGQLRMPVMS